MKKNRQVLNQEINKLYRQLGKEVFFDQRPELILTRQQKKIVKVIPRKIEKIEKVKEEEICVSTEALILEPEKNEMGIYEYIFCQHCHVGNHPESTHCIQCNQPL